MKLNKIELENFRQFKGNQTICFSADPLKNVTVIYGENGLGKTGIFRALMFCFYGDRKLSQDGDKNLFQDAKGESLNLVNHIALQENMGNPVAMKVSLDFSHNHSTYRMSRTLQSIRKADGQIVSDKKETVELQKTDSAGNTHPTIQDDWRIQSEIQSILSERLRDYFLFDGEQMERLTRNTKEQREEVKKGIRALLNLDALDLAIEGLEKYKQQTNKTIKQQSTGELQEISSEIEKLTEIIDQKEKETANKEKEIEQLAVQLEGLSQKIKANEAATALETHIQEQNNLQKEKQQQKEKLKEAMKVKLQESSSLLAFEATEQLREELESHRNKGELPPAIRKEFIEKLLHDQKCICGSSLDAQHPESRTNLEEFIKKTYVPGLNQHAEDLLNDMNKEAHVLPIKQKEFEKLLHAEQELMKEMEDCERKIDQLKEALKGKTPVLGLVEERDQCEKDRTKLHEDLYRLKHETDQKKKEREGLEKKREKLSKQEKHVKRLQDRYNLATQSKEQLQKIHKEFSQKVKRQLAEKSTEIFKKLTSSSTQQDISRLSINDDYTLDVLNWEGNRHSAEISAGQRQIVSLAFILGLIGIAGNLEMPLFMDTPFGRLSGENRDHLLQTIPQLATQWIVLATDTEMTSVEADVLRKTGTWGTIYELVKEKEGVTHIQQKEVEHFNPKRASLER